MIICNDIEIRNAHLTIKVYNNNNKGKMPERAHPTDAGYDVYYTREESIMIPSHQVVLIDIYIAIEIPVRIVC